MWHIITVTLVSVCRDASFGVCTFNLTLLDTLHGVNKVSDQLVGTLQSLFPHPFTPSPPLHCFPPLHSSPTCSLLPHAFTLPPPFTPFTLPLPIPCDTFLYFISTLFIFHNPVSSWCRYQSFIPLLQYFSDSVFP